MPKPDGCRIIMDLFHDSFIYSFSGIRFISTRVDLIKCSNLKMKYLIMSVWISTLLFPFETLGAEICCKFQSCDISRQEGKLPLLEKTTSNVILMLKLADVGTNVTPEAFAHCSGWSFSNKLLLAAVSRAADSENQTSQCCDSKKTKIPNQGFLWPNLLLRSQIEW